MIVQHLAGDESRVSRVGVDADENLTAQFRTVLEGGNDFAAPAEKEPEVSVSAWTCAASSFHLLSAELAVARCAGGLTASAWAARLCLRRRLNWSGSKFTE